MKITIGLFDTTPQAQTAAEELQQAGVDKSHLTVVVNNGSGAYDYYTGADTVIHNEKDSTGETLSTATGNERTLLGHDAVTVPGEHGDIAIGPLWGLKEANLDLLAGGMLGALVGAGIPDQTAAYLMEGVRRGGTLLMAEVPDSGTLTAITILDRNGAVDLPSRVTSWLDRGWQPYATDTTPFTVQEMQGERAYYDDTAIVPIANHI
jgi:hypothetical protein